MSESLNVLMVNYDYPPVGGIGTQRIFHFAKYLREMGINPIVLTSEHGLGKTRDLSATRDPAYNNIKVIRIGGNELIPYHRNSLTGLPAIFYKLRLSVKYFWFGQIYYSWFRESKDRLPDILTREKINCVWTTSPSYASLFFGKYAKSRFGIPWIVDFRDTMVDRINTERNIITRTLEFVDRFWEKKLCKRADHITCVSRPILENLIARTGYSWIAKNSSIIPNGYDPSDYRSETESVQTFGKGEKIHIVYTGTLFGRQKPTAFMDAMELLLQRQPQIAARLKFTFAGLFGEDITEFIREKLSGFDFRVLGFLERSEAVRLQLQGDILLLLTIDLPHKNANEILTGKVFEYIGARRPIFATATEGPLRELIREGKFGIIATPGNPEDIYSKFLDMCESMKVGTGLKFCPNDEIRRQYSRKVQLELLSEIIHKVTLQNRKSTIDRQA